jgi:hypothetical protein
MKVYEFDIILKDVSEVTDDLADALFEAGCDDGSFASRDGRAWLHFDREADSLEDAIRSAIADIQSAGLTASTVEMDARTTMAP